MTAKVDQDLVDRLAFRAASTENTEGPNSADTRTPGDGFGLVSNSWTSLLECGLPPTEGPGIRLYSLYATN